VAPVAYRRDRTVAGIVHLGIGAFHRAHQAIYTDDALAAGDAGWGIIGVSLRSPAVRDALAPQQCLYTVEARSAAGSSLRLVGAINDVLVAPESPERVIAALADPAVHIVTLTVTEKGYYRDAATGHLLMADAAVANDLSGGPPRTIFGYLSAALARRATSGAGPLTVISCDNLADNGRQLERLLGEFLSQSALQAASDWSCPNCVVDRIVPATTAADLSAGEVEDRGLVVTEPFRQWVIEDRFAGPRPRWELGGAQIVTDVRPFELAKLRLLNGSHSALAYWVLSLGLTYVRDAIRDADLSGFIRHQLRFEAAPSLPPSATLDPESYIDAILRRFDNPALPYRLAQIATDGSQKVPQRWLNTLIERDRMQLESPAHLLSLAAWLAYVGDRAGKPPSADDPLASQLRALWDSQRDPPNIVQAIVRSSGVFPSGFAESPRLIGQLSIALTHLLQHGPRNALQSLLQCPSGLAT
jgi:fructuronate reductase